MKNISKFTHSISRLFTTMFGLSSFFICPRILPGQKKRWKDFLGWDYAHRGLHDNLWGIPENSLPAFQAAVDKGYGIELYVHITADHQLIVHHDDTLYRMCRVERAIKDMTLEEIRQYTLLNTDEKIPTLKEVLDLVNGKVPLLIELKSESHNCDTLCRIFNHAMRANILLNPLILLLCAGSKKMSLPYCAVSSPATFLKKNPTAILFFS